MLLNNRKRRLSSNEKQRSKGFYGLGVHKGKFAWQHGIAINKHLNDCGSKGGDKSIN